MLHIFIQFIRTYSDSEGILEHVVSLIADVSSGESDHISTRVLLRVLDPHIFLWTRNPGRVLEL